MFAFVFIVVALLLAIFIPISLLPVLLKEGEYESLVHLQNKP